MSAECAIIASDTAPVKEVIKNGKTDVLVDFLIPKLWRAALILFWITKNDGLDWGPQPGLLW